MSATLWRSRWDWAGFVPSLPPKGRALMLAGGAVTGWASWPTLATIASPAPPFLILGIGAAVGFLVTLLLARRPSDPVRMLWRDWRSVTVVTAGVTLNDAFYLMAIPRLGAAEANVVHYLWPIFLCLIVAAVSRRIPGPAVFFGVLLAFIGAAVAIGPRFASGLDLAGLGFGLAGAATFAVYSAIRTYSQSASDVVGPAMGVVAVVALTAHFILEDAFMPDATQLVAIALIGLVPLTLSNRLWDMAVKTGQTATISSLAYLNPVIAMMLLTVFGIAVVAPATALAAVLVVLGAGLASRG